MTYKQFKDKKLSSLGFGAMRLPGTTPGWGAPIDYTKAEEMIDYAINSGINYFDTSYFYHDGDSERFLGNTLNKYPRDTWYINSKLPGNLMSYNNKQLTVSGKSFNKPIDIFEFQMERCKVDYFDFFMLHNVSESTYDIYTNEELGLIDCLIEQKAKGRIKHLGFSSHGRHDTIDKFLNYSKRAGFEFVMIQLNYVDWVLQEASKKYETITRHGLSVMAMEPLRGGRLAKMSGKAANLLGNNYTHAEWGFKFLQGLDNLLVVLSGMSNMEQLRENIKTFSEYKPLIGSEKEVLTKVVDTISERVPCTGCRYCIEHCPANLDIPLLLTLYNEAGYEIGWFLNAAIKALNESKLPNNCTICKNCIPLCPQNIDIPKALNEFSNMIK